MGWIECILECNAIHRRIDSLLAIAGPVEAFESVAAPPASPFDKAEADPEVLLNEAIAALDCFSKADIVELKSLACPPEGVMKTLGAMMILMGRTPSWSESKRALGDSTFLAKVKGFDKDNVSHATLRQLDKYCSDPSFTPENMRKISKAAAGLCQWVHAIKTYVVITDPTKATTGQSATQIETSRTPWSIQLLKKRDIQELKALGKPPQGIDDVFAAVAYLLRRDAQVEKLDWKGAQKMLADPIAFVDQLRLFDAESIPEVSLRKAQAIIGGMTYENIAKKSRAAAEIFRWCHDVCYLSSAAPQAANSLAAEFHIIESETSLEATGVQAAKALDVPKTKEVLISVASIRELKSLGRPPMEVPEVAAAVAYLLRGEAQVEKLDWKGAQKMMSTPTVFVAHLLALEAKSVPEVSLKKAQTILEHLTYKIMIGKSAAAAGLLLWCHEVLEACSQSSSGVQDFCEPLNTPAAVMSPESTAIAEKEKKKEAESSACN